MIPRRTFNSLEQGSPNTVLEGLCPAEFSSNPNQIHLKQLISVLKYILETSRQVCWGKLELNSAGHWPSKTKLVTTALEPLVTFYFKVSLLQLYI